MDYKDKPYIVSLADVLRFRTNDGDNKIPYVIADIMISLEPSYRRELKSKGLTIKELESEGDHLLFQLECKTASRALRARLEKINTNLLVKLG